MSASEDVRAENELWFKWWRQRARVAQELDEAGHHPDASLLVYAGLEALSLWWKALAGATFHTAKRRFGEFLLATADHADIFDRISLPSVWSRAKTDARLTPSERGLLENYDRTPHSHGHPIRILTDDPLRSTLLDPSSPLAPFANSRLTDKKGNRSGELGSDWLLDSRMGELLYERFRCPWVHEMRPGEGTSGFRRDTPGYFSAKFASPGALSFPITFMITVYDACISSTESLAQAKGLRPYRMGEGKDVGWK